MPPKSPKPLWRVKLYQLNGTGEWDDLGTGHISLSPAIASSSCAAPTLTLQKTSSDSNSDSPPTTQPDAVEIEVKHDVVYQRQGDNIITWFEQGTNGAEGGDLALSFQDNDGCREVWKGIFEAQKMAAEKAEKEGSMEHKRRKMNPESEGDMSEHSGHQQAMHQQMQNQPDPQYNLPAPLPENLGKIKDVLVEGKTEPHFNQRQTVNGIQQSLTTDNFQYINNLLSLSSNPSVIQSQPLKQNLAIILKSIVCMNDMSILEHLVIEATPFMLLCSILSLTQMISSITHKMPLSVTPILLKEIHKYYRLTFLRDNVMGSVEDGAGGVGSLLVFMASERTPPLLHPPSSSSSSPWTPVISPSEDSAPAKTSRLLVNLDYLLGFFTLLRPLQPAIKEEIFKHIGSTTTTPNLFSAIAHCLTLKISDLHALHAIHSKILTILTNLLQYDPDVVRTVAAVGMKRDDPDLCIISALGRFFATGTNIEVMFSVTEVLKLLLDSETLEPQTSTSIFLAPFFLKLMPLLTLPLTPSSGDAKFVASADICLPFTLELLNFAARHNSEHIKLWVTKGRGVGPMLDKIQKVQTHVKLTILRLIRTLLTLSDPPISQLIKLDFFSKIIPLFSPTSDNLIGSCIIEMVDFIKSEKRLKQLVTYLIEGWAPQFEEWGAKTETFRKLKIQYEQNLENKDPDKPLSLVEQLSARAALNSRFAGEAKSGAELEDHRKFQDVRNEESYFNDSDDDETPSSSNHNGGSYFSSVDKTNPGVKEATIGDGGGSGSGSGSVANDNDDDDDDDEGFEARLRLHALSAASSIAETVNKNKPAGGGASMKNGKPLLKNLLPYDDDSDSD
ncbi:hypothetical protein TrLO_g14677 [Triparma laevis f. longispina]|uniref:Serine/threonine-protein phosphatase 4 regulatory subunit 3-like central domain-containing protein n=1 Tax=Triparma laevis f. longispina TaxID=1714387 RepID=A0A9W7A309_9STRA|nr:hypothetical protein TrLO_g14677 [Triparma laevis f. longispina]